MAADPKLQDAMRKLRQPGQMLDCTLPKGNLASHLPIKDNEQKVIESIAPGLEGTLEEQELLKKKKQTDTNHDPNKFSQYGGWVVRGANPPTNTQSIYTVDHKVENRDIVSHHDEGDQEANCRKHILFGHGLKVKDVPFFFLIFSSKKVTG